MKITIKEYPATFSFEIKRKLPPFKCGCEVRGNLLLQELKAQKIESPNHAYEDYVVESVSVTSRGEQWGIGS